MKRQLIFFTILIISFPPILALLQFNGRFFYEGDGFISLTNTHNGKTISIQYRLADKSYDAKTLDQINFYLQKSKI